MPKEGGCNLALCPLSPGPVGGLCLEQRGDPGVQGAEGINAANLRFRLGYGHSRCDAL